VRPNPDKGERVFAGGVVAVPDDDESRATPQQPGPGPITTTILADQRRRARARIRAQDEHRRVCRELEQLASLVEYYTQPWWWAA
jgi:hypothetical protein